MKDIVTVMKFTIKDMLKRKSFIISTLIILILIVIGFNVPNVIKNLNGDSTGDKFLIVDNKNVFEGTLENLKQMDLGYEFEITNEDLKFEDIKNYIKDFDLEIETETNNNYIIKISDEEKAHKLLNKLIIDGINVDKFEIKKPTLNDIFIEKVGE